jgi:hypothetical protein
VLKQESYDIYQEATNLMSLRTLMIYQRLRANGWSCSDRILWYPHTPEAATLP